MNDNGSNYVVGVLVKHFVPEQSMFTSAKGGIDVSEVGPGHLTRVFGRWPLGDNGPHAFLLFAKVTSEERWVRHTVVGYNRAKNFPKRILCGLRLKISIANASRPG